MDDLQYEDISDSHRGAVQKCLKRLFRFRQHTFGDTEEWDPERSYSVSMDQPRDFLTKEERTRVRDAAFEHGSIPSYSSVTPDERDKWKIYLAQRFEKQKREVGKDDWKRANSWKIPSLVWSSLDAGLRPIEVERSRVSWVDVDNRVLRIPKEESSKNEDNWTVSITDRTAEALRRWIEERAVYPMYEETDAIWLTERGNPYRSTSLRRLLHSLCEIAGIDTEHRQMSWYTIRNSVGTYMTRERGLKAAQAQLRHKSPETTMRYDQVPVEDRRDALNRIGVATGHF